MCTKRKHSASPKEANATRRPDGLLVLYARRVPLTREHPRSTAFSAAEGQGMAEVGHPGC
jgi:hypothetical protein